MFLDVAHSASQFPPCFLASHTAPVSSRHVSYYRIQRQSIPCMFLSIAYSASQFPACFLISHAATGRCRLAWPRNTLFLVAADFAMPEIHYFWLSQTLQCPKYTISGCRRFCNARNTLFLTVADFAMPEIHYFWPPQTCMAPKYTISAPPPCPSEMEKRPPDTVSERSLFKENGRR